jgi:chitodextrinase
LTGALAGGVKGGATSFRDVGVSETATYSYTVVAVNESGFRSEPSTALDITYIPPVP